jgi:hypothetical protein
MIKMTETTKQEASKQAQNGEIDAAKMYQSGWEPDVLTKLDYDRNRVGCRIVFVNLA